MWDTSGDGLAKHPPRRDNRVPNEQRHAVDNSHKANRQKPWDRSTSKPLADQLASCTSDWQIGLSQKILVNHEAENPSSSGDWMNQLKEDSVRFLEEQKGNPSGKSRESIYKRGIEMLVDKIFRLLQRYMFDFNEVAAGTDLHVSGTISGDVTEVTRYNKLREAEETETYFRARFSTRLFSLVMRGRDECVQFYLLPVNLTIALSKCEKEFEPLAVLQVKISEEGMMWRMLDGHPAVDSLEDLSMWLFSQLVQQTRDASQGEGPALT